MQIISANINNGNNILFSIIPNPHWASTRQKYPQRTGPKEAQKPRRGPQKRSRAGHSDSEEGNTIHVRFRGKKSEAGKNRCASR